MDNNLLSRVPTHYLCPICGEYHPWDSTARLAYHMSNKRQFLKTCPNTPFTFDDKYYSGYFAGDNFYFDVSSLCPRGTSRITGYIPISEISENISEPVVTFNVAHKNNSTVSRYHCERCNFSQKCPAYRQYLLTGEEDFSMVRFGFKFHQEDYNNASSCGKITRVAADVNAKAKRLDEKERKLDERDAALLAATSNLEAEQQQLQLKREQLTADQTAFEDLKNNFYTAKEATTMSETATKSNNLFLQLYDHSPRENVAKVKEFLAKYHDVLSWAIPVLTVYGAYHILKRSEYDLNVNNISDKFAEKMGFRLELLDNHRLLRELLSIGGTAATAYTMVKGVSHILDNQKKTEISMEDVENSMDKLQGVSKKFSWLKPTMDDLLPVACSVLLVFATLHKPKFDHPILNKIKDFSASLDGHIHAGIRIAKGFLSDKLDLDLDDEKDQCKLRFIVLLTVILGVAAFLYGKKVLEAKKEGASDEATTDKKVNKSIRKFVDQAQAILEKIAPTLYTTLLTFMASKMLLHETPAQLPDHSTVIIDADDTNGDGTIQAPNTTESDASDTLTQS